MENPIKMDDLGGKPTIFGNIHFQPTQLNGGPSQVLDRSVDVLSLSPTAGARFNPRWVGKFYPEAEKTGSPKNTMYCLKTIFFGWFQIRNAVYVTKTKLWEDFFHTSKTHIETSISGPEGSSENQLMMH